MKEKVKQIIGEIKNDPSLAGTINDSTDIINDIGLDSLQMINFALRIEDEFNVELDFEQFDFSYFNSLSAFCDFLNQMVIKSQVA